MNIGFGKMRFLRSNLLLPVVCTFSSKKGWEMLGDNCDDLPSPFIRSQKVSAGSEWPDGARISYQTNLKLEMYPPEIPLKLTEKRMDSQRQHKNVMNLEHLGTPSHGKCGTIKQ